MGTYSRTYAGFKPECDISVSSLLDIIVANNLPELIGREW